MKRGASARTKPPEVDSDVDREVTVVSDKFDDCFGFRDVVRDPCTLHCVRRTVILFMYAMLLNWMTKSISLASLD